MPPALMLGQDTFISRPSTPSSAARRAPQSTYSSNVVPKKLTKTRVPQERRNGSFSRANASTPTFSRPMEFSIPAAVSQMRGGGLPKRGFGRDALGDQSPQAAQEKAERQTPGHNQMCPTP